VGHRRLIAALLVLAVAACSDEEPQSPPRGQHLLVPVYFYQGHTVGKASRPTGLQVSVDDGETWKCVTWPELITNSVAVDASGRWVYLACGNGVMVSRNGGTSWRLTGGWEMTEVQRVTIDRRHPTRAWAATAYGVWRTSDAGGAWTRIDHEGLFRHCTDVLVSEVDDIWVAAHDGIFLSRDYGKTFAGVRSGPVRRIAEVEWRILAASDGDGLLTTEDCGETWARIEGPPDVTFCVVADGDALYVGSTEGLSVSRDGGRTWRTSSDGMPEDFYVYGVLPLGDRVLVCGSDGLLESRDGGATFARLAFEGALIHDLAAADLDLSAPNFSSPTPPGFTFHGPFPREHRPRRDDPTFGERWRSLVYHFRTMPAPPEGNWRGWARAAFDLSSLGRGVDTEAVLAQVEEQLAAPKRSMFFSLPLMGLYLYDRMYLPPRIAEAIMNVMTMNPVYRGDTENHWVMHYAAVLLAAQTWPDTPPEEWYTGRTSREMYDEAKGWLLHWARLTAAIGQGEYDSPNYMFMYVVPMLLLYDFAREPEVRQMAGMMLDLLLADYFAESLKGAWCGGHSRIIGKEVELTCANRVSVLHWLYAGGIKRPDKIHGWAAWAALSSYRPPAVLEAVANERRKPFVHMERKRVRNVIRYGEALNPPVWKYDYMTPLYCLGSTQGGILQPIQQHTWDVTWLGSAENSTLFTVHPSVSARELAMFFPEDVHQITRTVTAQKGVYASPDKLVSASPWEEVRQRENVLVARYRVPRGERFPHVDLYWPSCLERTEEGGWLFGRDGEFWLGVRPSRKGEWIRCDGYEKLRCPAQRVEFVVVTRPSGEWGLRSTFEEFRKGLRASPVPDVETLYPDRDRWLFDGPHLYSETGSRVIHMTDGRVTRILDFNDMTITESR
jgi:photosystem II stability/assembly factor-like uncharacterized protein